MRFHLLVTGLACLLAAPRPAVAATVVKAIYVAEEEKTYWEPMSRGDIERLIEQTALEVITKAGILTLTKVEPKDLANARGDYLLRISGRMVGESETHTIQLGFEARDKAEVGSFRAAATVIIGKLPLDEMRKRIESSTRIAAEQLIAALKPALQRLGPSLGPDQGVKPDSSDTTPPPPAPEIPWNWGDVRIPDPPKGEVDDLFGKNNEKREQTLRLLMSEALVTPTRRNGLEVCAVKHPDPEVRLQCLVALRPSSRKIIPTQRIVISVFRSDKDEKIVSEASAQMEYFTGMSRNEAIQAWLERSGNSAAIYGPLEKLGDVPNLDQTIAKCLVVGGKREPEYARSHRACIEMMKPLDVTRRRALLWPYLKELNAHSPFYLKGAGKNEGSTGTEWQWGWEAVVQLSCKLDQPMEDVLWNRYLRELSSSAVAAMADYGTPTEELVQRLAQAVQTGGERQAVMGLRHFYETAPALRPTIKNRVAEMSATGNYDKNADVPHLEEELDQIDANEAKEEQMIALVAALAVTVMQPPVVKYVISVETRTWKPIEPKDVERILDNSAVSPLLQRGDMNLQKSDFAGLKQGDYTLLVSGRFIEEAEDFSVYMTFGPGQKTDLPSFHVAGTENVGKRGMQEMQKIMEKLANQTASRLNQLLAPQLRQVALPIVPDSVGDVGVPQLWQWPKMIAPEVPKPSQMVQTLIDPRHGDNERSAAVAGIATAAFDELAARKALERCVLRDPSPHVRSQCVQALEPVARVNVSTQRVLLYAMRNEYDEQVLSTLAKVSQGFTGLSRSEAIDTWLFLMASAATPAEAVDDIAHVLGKEGNVPNLDVAIASCLRQGNVVGMKKYYCADRLLRTLPPERRVSVGYDYIEHADQMDLRDHMTMGEVMDWLTRDKMLPQGRQCDILTQLALRSDDQSVQSKAVYVAGQCKDPTTAMVDAMAGRINAMNGWWMTRPLYDIGAKEERRHDVINALAKAQARLKKDGCTPRPHAGQATKEVQELLERLSKKN